jgi:ribosome-associated protein
MKLLCIGVFLSRASAFMAPFMGNRHSRAWHLHLSSPDSSNKNFKSNKSKNKPMLNFMDKLVVNNVGDNPRPESIPIQDDPSADLVRCIVMAADGRKAENIVALRVSPVSTLTSFMIFLSGNSRPQNQAIAAAIQKEVLDQFDARPLGNGVPEGSAQSGWTLLDYGSVICHVMTPKSRLYYNVEGQWREKGGMEMDLSNIIVPNNAVVKTASPEDSTMDIDDQEDDPFWS